MNRIAKLLAVSIPTVQAWIEQFARADAPKPAPRARARVVALERIWHYLKKVQQALGVEGLGSGFGALVDWGLRGHARATLERLLAPLKRWRARLCCADGWETYADWLPAGQLDAGKDAAHGMERNHTRQRHRLARFRRRSIVISKSVRVVDAVLPLFAAFAGDDRIHRPLSTQA